MSVDLAVENVSVALGGTTVLDDISLDVQAGEFVTLLGHSGSGKTTMLNIVAGFIKQDAGRILFAGEPVDAVPPIDRDIGIVFQSYALFPHMTVLQNVMFPLQVRGVGRQERMRRAKEYLELVQLGDLSGRRAAQLSGGQQQRVALARALVFEPTLLLLDEPLAALDKQLRESMQLELKRIQREVGVTTIAVTHDQTEALAMSDRVAVMGTGSLEQFATPEDIYQRPTTDFVARFIGEANMLPVDDDGTVSALGVRLPDCQGGTAVIRPEHLRLSAGPRHPDGAAGRVAEAVYQGTRYRVIVHLDQQDEHRLVVSAPWQPGVEQLAVGTRVHVSCAPESVHVIASAGQYIAAKN